MKQWSNIYNPFNSLKLLRWVNHWESMEWDDIKPPILVTIDPTNACNLNCSFCNAAKIRQDTHNATMSGNYIEKLVPFLSEWGVRAVCIAGGGEPFVNPYTPEMIDQLLDYGIKVGIVTNGTLLNNEYIIKIVNKCSWLGVSVDEGDKYGYAKLKGTNPVAFETVINNIKCIREYKIANKTNLQIGYKYVITPNNIKSIYKAARLAKNIGCEFIHLRPVGATWFDNPNKLIFSEQEVKMAQLYIHRAFNLEGLVEPEGHIFRVYGVIHKFSKKWHKKFTFKTCHALGMTCIFQPNGTVGLCCDRRGDSDVTLCTDLIDPKEVLNYWSTQKHLDIIKNVNFAKCPTRCTYQPHNEIYENVIMQDLMYSEFI